PAGAAGPGAPAAGAEAKGGTGDGHPPAPHAHANGEAAPRGALAPPETRAVPLALAPPEVTAPAGAPKREEVFLAGLPGEELRDYAYRYYSGARARETAVSFRGPDLRAFGAPPANPLRREAVYLGRVDARRLFAARKLSDTHHVGPAGHERRDRRVEYFPDGSAARTVVFVYE